MHLVQAKTILSANNGVNIYRGCTHGCIYCDSRSDCYNMNHDFEDIEVKANAPQLLNRALASKRKKCMVGTGAMSDPYNPLELEFRLCGNAWRLSTDAASEPRFLPSRFAFCVTLIFWFLLTTNARLWCR